MPQNTITFDTDRGPVIIELIPNNKFIDFWLPHFVKTQTNFTMKKEMVLWPNPFPRDARVPSLIQRIIDTISTINSADYLVPLPTLCNYSDLETLDLPAQQILNALHRHAVTATETRDRWVLDSGPQFAWVDWNNEHFNYHINVLNQGIHDLENYVQTPHKTKFKGIWPYIELKVDASLYDDVNVYHDSVDLPIPDELQSNLSLEKYNVWIKKDLLGKDYATAFFDHDDPTEFDVRPPPMISGGLHIFLNDGKHRLFDSPEFRSWLGADPGAQHGSYPIGNVISGIDHLLKATTVTFKSVD